MIRGTINETQEKIARLEAWAKAEEVRQEARAMVRASRAAGNPKTATLYALSAMYYCLEAMEEPRLSDGMRHDLMEVARSARIEAYESVTNSTMSFKD